MTFLYFRLTEDGMCLRLPERIRREGSVYEECILSGKFV
jgi:hypothetical protein